LVRMNCPATTPSRCVLAFLLYLFRASCCATSFTTCFIIIDGADAFVPLQHAVPRSTTTTIFRQTPPPQNKKNSVVRIMMASSSEDNDDNDFTTTTTSPPLSLLKKKNDGIPFTPFDRPVLSMIDTVSLLIFAAIGKASHSAVDGSIDIGAVLVTASPFLLSWFVVSPFVGCYTPDATKDVPSAAIQVAKGWIIAVPMGCILRGLIKGYVPPVPFVAVTLLSTLVILSIGRVGYTVLSELYVEMF